MAVKATTPAIMRRQDRRSGLQQMDLFRTEVAAAPARPDGRSFRRKRGTR